MNLFFWEERMKKSRDLELKLAKVRRRGQYADLSKWFSLARGWPSSWRDWGTEQVTISDLIIYTSFVERETLRVKQREPDAQSSSMWTKDTIWSLACSTMDFQRFCVMTHCSIRVFLERISKMLLWEVDIGPQCKSMTRSNLSLISLFQLVAYYYNFTLSINENVCWPTTLRFVSGLSSQNLILQWLTVDCTKPLKLFNVVRIND